MLTSVFLALHAAATGQTIIKDGRRYRSFSAPDADDFTQVIHRKMKSAFDHPDQTAHTSDRCRALHFFGTKIPTGAYHDMLEEDCGE